MAIVARAPMTPEEQQLFFSANTYHRQFSAIAYKLSTCGLENEIAKNSYLRRLEIAKECDINEVAKWLKNGWNTEYILGLSQTMIAGNGHTFALQWSFPQAYYSVFGTLMAMFKAVGYTETSHAAVLKKFGKMCSENKLPDSISFHLEGPTESFAFRKIAVPAGYDTMDFSVRIPQTVDHQICQVLKSTRQLKLKEYAPVFIRNRKLKTKKGKPKKVLSPEEWGLVSSDLSCTTLMDFLYRKRIKANYKEVDVFTYDGLKGSEILSNLLTIVDRLNLVNETYVAKVLGNSYTEIVSAYLRKLPHDILEARTRRTISLADSLSGALASARD